MHGQYRVWLPKTIDGYRQNEGLILPNTIPNEGEEAYLKMLMRDDQTIVAGAANFSVGLCDQIPNQDDVYADITTEPDATGGYARQTIARSAVGWPTIFTSNSRAGIRSLLISFAASGADFEFAISRAFMTDGTLILSYSGPLAEAIVIPDGQQMDVQYELYLN